MGKPRRPRVGPRNPSAAPHGFPVGRCTANVSKGGVSGAKGRGSRRTVSALRPARASKPRSLGCVVPNGRGVPRSSGIMRQGVYPKDHPIMVRAAMLAKKGYHV